MNKSKVGASFTLRRIQCGKYQLLKYNFQLADYFYIANLPNPNTRDDASSFLERQ